MEFSSTTNINPKISIIMGVYNAQKYLKRSIDSIIWQTYSNWEFVICDDGSVDDTVKIIEDFNDPRIILLKNKVNHGLGQALNRCIEKSSGKYIARQDADDFSFFDRFKRQVEYLENNPEVDIIGSDALLVDEKDNIWGIFPASENFTIKNWIKGTQITHPTAMMKKDMLVKIGKYNADALRIEDYELWMRMLKQNVKFGNLGDKLYYYRLSWDDYSKKKVKNRLGEIRYRYLCYKQFNFPPMSYLYLLKTFIMIFIPKFLLYRYHRKKFGIRSWRYV